MTCARCERDNPPGSRFCNACGARLDAPTDSGRSSQAYTPQDVSEKPLTSRTALVGERKQVTVLFADLKSSMRLLVHRDPEEAQRVLDAVLERLMEAVHRYEGTVNQVMGDGIMALFGAPLAHEDHAVRACYAALRMQDTVSRYAKEVEDAEGLPIQLRVGLNSGEVIVRSIGSDLHMDYTAIGATTHLAARMEQMATPGSILITESTIRFAQGAIAVRPLGRRSVKGLDETIKVYELTAGVPERSVLKTTVGQRRSRFLGREDELERLSSILRDGRRGQGQVAAVSGEAGIGKSRLVYEFLQTTPVSEWRVLECQALSYEMHTPWAPIVKLLQRYFDCDTREVTKDIADSVSKKLLALDAGLGDVVAPVLALLGALPEHHAWHGVDAPERRRRVLDALTRLILKETEQQPLLIVFENLQWVDSETRAFLDSVVSRVMTAPLIVLVDYRPEFRHDWAAHAHFTEIALTALSPVAAHRLLDTLLRGDRHLAPLKELLVARSQGNPFFLEEIVRTLTETKVIVADRGTYRLTRDLLTVEVPATVQSIIAARIDRLPAADKTLLQAAAVIGMSVPAALLEAVTQRPLTELDGSLRALVAAGFLEQTPAYPDVEYRFRNALTRDVAAGSLLRDQRRELHAAIVNAIETVYRECLTNWVDQLAHHASLGEMWAKAATYNRQAGARAAAHAANVEARQDYETALRALGRLPQTRETLEDAIDVRLELRAPLLQLGRLDDVLAVSREAERIAGELGDDRRLARVYTYLVNYHYLKGDIAAAIDYGRRCLEVGCSTGDAALQGLARQYMGQSYHLRGDYSEAQRILRENLELDPSNGGIVHIASCGWLTWVLAERGDFEAAYACLDLAHRAAEQSAQAYGEAIAWAMSGLVAIKAGDLTRAVLPLSRSLAVCRRKHLPLWQPIPSSLLGLAFVRMGHVAKGVRLLEDSVALSRELGIRAYLAAWLLNLAEGYLADKQHERAKDTANEALALARAGGERAHQAYAHFVLGEIAARNEVPAVADYETALHMAHELSLRPLAASVHLGLQKLYASGGDDAASERHATLAQTLIRELGLHAWWEVPPDHRKRDSLFIVARSNAELYEFLAENLAGAPDIEVILDRRRAERRRSGPTNPEDRRRKERRQTPLVDEDLRNWQVAVAAKRDR